jgi:predicted dinucleotide-binding enzyme
VVAGFHTIGAHTLAALDREVDSDALLCADDEAAKRLVGHLIESVPGMRWVDAGPLANARLTEPLTPLVITINRRYKLKDGGFRITGRNSWGVPSS